MIESAPFVYKIISSFSFFIIIDCLFLFLFHFFYKCLILFNFYKNYLIVKYLVLLNSNTYNNLNFYSPYPTTFTSISLFSLIPKNSYPAYLAKFTKANSSGEEAFTLTNFFLIFLYYYNYI